MRITDEQLERLLVGPGHISKEAFAGAAEVYVYEPPQDGKDTQLSLNEIMERINATGIQAYGMHAAPGLLASLQKNLQANDCILLSSSGAMGGLVESVPHLCEELFPIQK